ncbi:MAG: alpha/beta fold hydrolase [Alphaproteobacteria bacterium]|nr:alpha/beta fold hydrolase [Alphaproteobacteria bacterium]
MRVRFVLSALLIAAATPVFAEEPKWPNYQEADFTVKNYIFKSGESLPEVKLHYRTLGTPKHDGSGAIVNGVLLLQGNTGTGANWLRPSLADELFKAGEPLDVSQYFVIMPDAIGRGGSSKPSDGPRAEFPHYRYHDMIDLYHRLIADGLGIKHLRLVLGSSLGCMHTWMWGEMYAGEVDGLVALSCQPVEISGRNRISRLAAAQSIRHDPGYQDGKYDKPPTVWMYAAAGSSFFTESPVRIQEMAPSRAAADALYQKRLQQMQGRDANDVLYELESIEDYSPEAELDKITAKVLLINDSEDFADPPTLGTVERAMQRVKQGRYVLIPPGPNTHGHFSHYYAAVWKPYLAEFLQSLGPTKAAAK